MILQPDDIAIDYSFARPDPAAIVGAGVKLVVRYISPTRSNKKNITVAERDALLDAGLSLLLVWENAARDPLQGVILGAQHGAQAGAFAQDLGYPKDLPIIVAVDFGVLAAQMTVVLHYLGAFKQASGYPQGAYGSDSLVTAAHDAGVSTLGWQTRAWSSGRRSPHADCLQQIGFVHPEVATLGAVDDNTVLRPFAAWSTSTAPPTPPVPVPPEEQHMAYFRDDRAAGWQIWVVSTDAVGNVWTCPITDLPDRGKWEKVQPILGDPPVKPFGSLVALMDAQNRPSVVVPPPGVLADHTHLGGVTGPTGGVIR